MEITGKFLQALPEHKMKSRDGNDLTKQDFIIETEAKYPKKVCISCWNDKALAIKQLKPGDEIKAQIDIESREYNGRWYTNIKAWEVEPTNPMTSTAPPPHVTSDIPPVANDDLDDLPF